MAKKSDLDIFNLFSKIDSGDYFIWDNLSEVEQKAFSGLIIMRWLTGTSDFRQIVFLNELLNKILFGISKHPELQLKLMVCSNSKIKNFYYWLPIKSSKKDNNIILNLVKEYYNYSTREAKYVIDLIPDTDLLHMAEDLGYEKTDIAKIKKAIKSRTK